MTISANTRSRVVVLLTSVALVLALLLAFSVVARADDADTPTGSAVSSITHVVRSGDTLWDIASGVAEPGSDVRNVVEDIKRANGLRDSLIHPGQVLVVPVGG
jgi:nucleoid-associated protein YgaU